MNCPGCHLPLQEAVVAVPCGRYEIDVRRWTCDSCRKMVAFRDDIIGIRSTTIDSAGLLALLIARIGAHGVRSLAKEIGCSPSFLSQITLSKARISDRIARFLGYERVVLWRSLPTVSEASE